MSYLSKSNLAYALVAVAPSPALSGTTLTVAAGKGSLFPAANFTITVYPPNTPPLASNAEICLCTSRAGDVLTIVRAQEGTTAKSIVSGWQVANTATALDFTEIENSIIQFISAGTTKASASEVVFSNSNGVSFGVAGQTVTASIGTNAFTQSTQPVAASASNGSFLFSTLGFSNANNVTFGTSAGSIITASVGAGTQSTQPVAASASNGSFLFSTLGFSNAHGVTFGTSAGSIITASIVPGAGVAISANGSSVSAGTVVFSNSNGVSFGMNGSTVTASKDNLVISANNGTFQSSIVAFEGDGNITVQTAGGNVVSFHVDLQSVQPVAASASNGSFLFSTLGFSNANGVTFGTSAGSIVTASVGAGASPGSISAGASSIALGQVIFSNSNNVSFGLNGSTVTASASNAQSTQPVAASASNGSFLFSTLGFSNANGVTFGTSAGSIMTASVVAAGGGATYQKFAPINPISTVNAAPINQQNELVEFAIPANMSMNWGRVIVSFASTSSNIATSAVAAATMSYGASHSMSFGIYTFGTGASSNSISLASSGEAHFIWSNGLTITNSTQYTANMGLTYPSVNGGGDSNTSTQIITSATQYSFNNSIFSDWAGSKFVDVPVVANITPGHYIAAFASSTASASGSTGANLTAIANPKLSGVSVLFINGPSGVNLFMGYTSGSDFGLSDGNYSRFSNSFNRTEIVVNANNRSLYFQIGT